MKNKKPQISKNPDLFDMVLDGVSERLGVLFTWLANKAWELLSDFVRKKFDIHFRGKSSSLPMSVETMSTPSKWSSWEQPLFSHRLQKETNFAKVDFNINTVVMGTTGQGKNALMDNIINERLQDGYPVVFIAPKGDAEDVTKFRLLNEYHGRKSIVISDIVKSDSFNPIAEGSVSAITERIHSSFSWSEQYYSDVAYNALKTAISIIKRDYGPISKEQEAKYESIKVKGDLTPTFEKIEYVLNELYPHGTAERKETIGLINKINKINTSNFSHLFNRDDAWTFSKVRKEKRSIIFSISNLCFPELVKMLGRVIVLDLQFHASEIFALRDSGIDHISPMSIVIDELGTVATPGFINLFNQCRGAKMSVLAAFQCLADLNTVGPDFQSRVISNTNNFFIGLMKHPGEAELLSKMIGTKGVKKVTRRAHKDEELEEGSVRDAHEFLIPPDLFKSGNTGIFIVKTFLGKHHVNDIVTVKLKFTPENLRKMVKARGVVVGEPVKIIDEKFIPTKQVYPDYFKNFPKNIKDYGSDTQSGWRH